MAGAQQYPPVSLPLGEGVLAEGQTDEGAGLRLLFCRGGTLYRLVNGPIEGIRPLREERTFLYPP